MGATSCFRGASPGRQHRSQATKSAGSDVPPLAPRADMIGTATVCTGRNWPPLWGSRGPADVGLASVDRRDGRGPAAIWSRPVASRWPRPPAMRRWRSGGCVPWAGGRAGNALRRRVAVIFSPGGDHRGGVQPAGGAGQALDGPGDRDGGDDLAALAAHRGGHRGHPGLALGDAGGPAAPPHLGQGGGGELGPPQAPVHPVRLVPGEQDLGGRARRSWAARTRPGRCRGARWRAPPPPRRSGSRPGAGRAARSPRSGRAAGSGWAGRWRGAGPPRPPWPARPAGGPARTAPGNRRLTRRCRSSATAIRCAVGRARPVAATSWASEAGPDSRVVSTATDLVQDADSARVVHGSILPSRICETQDRPDVTRGER